MNYYELREDGVLWHKMCSYDWVDDPASPFGGHSKIRDVKWLPKTDVEGSVEIHERKGQLPLVKAWIHWVKTTRLTDARLMIVGPSEDIAYRAELGRLLESESMAGSTVVFTGQVTDTGKYLSAADIYVSAAQAEGLPIAIVEALAHGLPVVCRWLSGVTGDFMFGGAVTPVYNWNDETFSGAISPMLDPLMRSAASADARHVAEMRFEVHSRLGRLRQLLS